MTNRNMAHCRLDLLCSYSHCEHTENSIATLLIPVSTKWPQLVQDAVIIYIRTNHVLLIYTGMSFSPIHNQISTLNCSYTEKRPSLLQANYINKTYQPFAFWFTPHIYRIQVFCLYSARMPLRRLSSLD